MAFRLFCIIAVMFLAVVLGQEDHQEDEHFANFLHSNDHIHNKEHLQEHLKDFTGDDMSLDSKNEEEIEFHYFKLHDYDNNNKLDGLELAAAMTHFHNEDGSKSKAPTLSDEQLAQIVDQVLNDDDINNDGYVHYYEFARAQKMDQELAKSQGA
ncbi:multiple coagulation factor deficiency protein 2 homolog [Dysidea avara]|uniref:multiple coagulation factor deficiency protein 2 homolog n=1 Tax=Dysidea avara TaxID=196820 RepID=UPI00332B34EF